MSFLNWRTKEFDHMQHVSALRQGSLPCTKCGKTQPMDELEPLTLARCPKCKDMLIVPLHVAGFWLCKPLGAGGMGATYLAWRDYDDFAPGYAVKILPRDGKHNPRLIANLQQEANVVMALGVHPAIVHGVAAGVDGDEHYLATRFVDGERLDVMIERKKKIPELEAIGIALRLLGAEAHIYNQGYLFRDLKPQNVIVGDEGAFLFDYGICETLENALIDDGDDAVQGSALYIPPERLTGEGERASAEIYSLGMVFYQMVKGTPYFDSDEIASLARQHVREFRLDNDTDKMKGLPWDLTEVLQKMIVREVSERFASFAEVEYELMAILAKRLSEAS